MSFDFSAVERKHAVVTGGSRGIGLAIARALASHGARVSIVSRRPGELEGFTTAQCDVGNETDVGNAFNACRKKNGPIAILVNNSGISDSAPVVRTTKEMWDKIIATNLTGTFLCTRTALPDMIAAKWGRVLNVASIAGLSGAPYISAYTASKHGMIGLTRAVAAEFQGKDITANALCPGYTETDMMQQAIRSIVKHTNGTEDAARQALAHMNPEGRIATAEEVAIAALDLICGGRTGISLVIPGGMEK
ncbi:MAG TPA: SDR family oxidoreductase [Candidatus Baltobacteraceae bacterium]|jgi:NAD(P)-dependent dehydrogenase (short-subunit alcohol dehydrogenase family)|nr:SDR family oxidoreductase [Candidatus Baltobacteraceae bacterium]